MTKESQKLYFLPKEMGHSVIFQDDRAVINEVYKEIMIKRYIKPLTSFSSMHAIKYLDKSEVNKYKNEIMPNDAFFLKKDSNYLINQCQKSSINNHHKKQITVNLHHIINGKNKYGI